MGNRELDNPYYRIQKDGSYKQRRFDGKRSMKDDYTGERIFYGNSSDAKYRHPMEKCADIDHVTPLKVVEGRYSDLKPEQQKTIANSDSNFAVTSARINRSKNSLENHEYVVREAKNAVDSLKQGNFNSAKEQSRELINNAPRMLSKEIKSRAGMAVEGNKFRLQNIAEPIATVVNAKNVDQLLGESIRAGNCAVTEVGVPLIANAVHSAVKVAEGEISASDAVSDTAVMTGGVWMKGVVEHKVQEMITKNHRVTLEIMDLAKSPQISVAGTAICCTLYKWINGEIDDDELAENIGTDILSSQIQMALSEIAGSVLLPIPVVGQIVGAAVVSVVCGKVIDICKEIGKTYKSLKHINDNAAEISSLAYKAEQEIEKQRKKFAEYADEFNAGLERQFKDAFQMIGRGVGDNSYEETSDGLEMIANIFDASVEDVNMEWLKNGWRNMERGDRHGFDSRSNRV